MTQNGNNGRKLPGFALDKMGFATFPYNIQKVIALNILTYSIKAVKNYTYSEVCMNECMDACKPCKKGCHV